MDYPNKHVHDRSLTFPLYYLLVHEWIFIYVHKLIKKCLYFKAFEDTMSEFEVGDVRCLN